jgi:hypothetical protein
MPKITGLGAGAAPANTDVLVLVSNTAGTANTQKVTVNTFFSDVTANVKFANAEVTIANVETLYARSGHLQGVDIGTSTQAVGTFTNLTSLANTDLQGGLTIGHEEITSNGAISTYVPLTILKGDSGVVAATLANSANMGQLKIITAYHTTAATSLAVASTLGAGETYTFQTNGETIMLIWTGDHWALISKSGNPTGSNLAGTMDVT